MISALYSWPSTTGRARSIVNGPFAARDHSVSSRPCCSTCRSDAHTPQASVRTSTSPSRGTGSGSAPTSSFPLRMYAACIAARLTSLGIVDQVDPRHQLRDECRARQRDARVAREVERAREVLLGVVQL